MTILVFEVVVTFVCEVVFLVVDQLVLEGG
jgi:hypothetical protein